MLYTKKALQMGAIAVGLAAFAGQSSLAESAKKEDSKPSASSETMQVMPELTMASHFTGVPYNRSGVSVSIINPEEFQKAAIETLTGALSQTPGVFTLDGGGTWQPWIGSYELGDIPSGRSRSLLLAGQVDACAQGVLVNRAAVTALSLELRPEDNEASAATVVWRPWCQGPMPRHRQLPC